MKAEQDVMKRVMIIVASFGVIWFARVYILQTDVEEPDSMLQPQLTAYDCFDADQSSLEECAGKIFSITARFIEQRDEDWIFELVNGSAEQSSTNVKFRVFNLQGIDSPIRCQRTLSFAGELIFDESNVNSEFSNYYVPLALVETSLRDSPNREPVQEEPTFSLLDDIIEQDAQLLEAAQRRRQQLIDESMRHSIVSRAGILIESFELPNNRFISCSMTWPGPVYSCDGRL